MLLQGLRRDEINDNIGGNSTVEYPYKEDAMRTFKVCYIAHGRQVTEKVQARSIKEANDICIKRGATKIMFVVVAG